MSSTRRTTRQRPAARPSAAEVARLARYFHRNGYVRWQDEERVSDEGWESYRKGHEVRLVAESAEELATIRRLLERAGFRPGKPFVKGRQYRQPVYGKQAVVRFLDLVDGWDI